jgi:predicted nucleic acid-binding protein
MYAKGVEIAVPDLLIYEIANALRYNKSLSEEEIKEAVNSLVKMGLSLVVPMQEVTDLAITLAIKYNLTVYDAYFLSLAQTLRFVCVTADEKMYRKTESLGFVKLLKEV